MKFLYSIVIFFVAIAVSYGRPEIDLKRPYLSSPVIIDGKELGLLWLYPKHNGQKLLVEVVPLLRYLGPYLADKDAVNSFKKNKKNRFIESDQLEQLGMSVVFDDEQLLLRANIRPSIRTQSSVDISEESRSITIVPDQNAAFSGFANIYLNQPFSNLNESQESIERDPFLGTADTTINLLGVALVSGVDYTENSEQELLRKNTWAEYDFKGLKSRFSFGEIEYSSVGYIVEGEVLGHH